MLRELCRPVNIQNGGATWDAVAKQLGTGFTGLHKARVSGRLRARYVEHLHGRPGPATAILSCDQPLDPNGREFSTVDPVWGISAMNLVEKIPDDFEATLTRVPVFHGAVSRRKFDEHLHPEVRDSRRENKREPLPPPPVDWTHYKIKDGVPVEDKIARLLREKRERENIRHTAWRRKHPKPSKAGGSMQFRGWMWVCPKCGKRVRVVYLPMRAELSVVSDRWSVENPSPLFLTTDHRPLNTFACYACHNIRSFSRIDKNSWNELISYLSGGLLYGREVPKPAWFTGEAVRKREYRPRFGRGVVRDLAAVLVPRERGASTAAKCGTTSFSKKVA